MLLVFSDGPLFGMLSTKSVCVCLQTQARARQDLDVLAFRDKKRGTSYTVICAPSFKGASTCSSAN